MIDNANAARRRPNAPSIFAPHPALTERATRYRARREQRPPRAVMRLVRAPNATLGALPLLADGIEREHAAPLQTLRLRRHGLPSVIFSPETGCWYCAAGYADGRSILSLAMWMRDRDMMATMGFLLALLAINSRVAA